MSTERERKLEEVLKQFLKPIRNIPFEIVIQSLYGTEVRKFDTGSRQNKKTLDRLIVAIRSACETVRKNPIIRARPNEVGNDMEPFVIRALIENNFKAGSPKTKRGAGKSTGYPDIFIDDDDPIYLEVKSFAAANQETTQRSFYLSPTDDPKVIKPAYHLVVGFEIARQGDHYTPSAFEIADLYGLDCDMKAEFNSDNRRLYNCARILAKERV